MKLSCDSKNYILKGSNANMRKIHSFYPNIDQTPFISQVHQDTNSQCSSGCISAFACKAKMVILWSSRAEGGRVQHKDPGHYFFDVSDSGQTKPPHGCLVIGANKHCFVTLTNTRTNSNLYGPRTQTLEMRQLTGQSGLARVVWRQYSVI